MLSAGWRTRDTGGITECKSEGLRIVGWGAGVG